MICRVICHVSRRVICHVTPEEAGLKSICFCSVRKICELVLDYTRTQLAHDAPELEQRVAAYRGGLNPVAGPLPGSFPEVSQKFAGSFPAT